MVSLLLCVMSKRRVGAIYDNDGYGVERGRMQQSRDERQLVSQATQVRALLFSLCERTREALY